MFHWRKEIARLPDLCFPFREAFPGRNTRSRALERVKHPGILSAKLTNVVEGLTVDGAGAEAANGFLMGGCRVALVVGKAVARESRVKLGHEAVTVYLGDNRCRSD